MFQHALTRQITEFLTQIGLLVRATTVQTTTFLPGIDIRGGELWVDEAALSYPGDLLHEAGHLALLSPSARSQMHGDAAHVDKQADAIEVAAIAWSYAAARHLGIDVREVFHDGGYRVQAAGLRQTYASGVYLGAARLVEFGLTRIGQPGQVGSGIYPDMLRWLRQ